MDLLHISFSYIMHIYLAFFVIYFGSEGFGLSF